MIGHIGCRMNSDTYNLSWNDSIKCASNTFKELHSETEFADVTLVSDDLKQIKAHKVIVTGSTSRWKIRVVLQ